MSHDMSAVRNLLHHVPQVMRTWFELEAGLGDGPDQRTLVVEVTFDLDPVALHYNQKAIDAIKDTARSTAAEGSATFSRLRIVTS